MEKLIQKTFSEGNFANKTVLYDVPVVKNIPARVRGVFSADQLDRIADFCKIHNFEIVTTS